MQNSGDQYDSVNQVVLRFADGDVRGGYVLGTYGPYAVVTDDPTSNRFPRFFARRAGLSGTYHVLDERPTPADFQII